MRPKADGSQLRPLTYRMEPKLKADKCSAVAEMDDRLATIDTDRKLGGGCAPLGDGSWFPI